MIILLLAALISSAATWTTLLAFGYSAAFVFAVAAVAGSLFTALTAGVLYSRATPSWGRAGEPRRRHRPSVMAHNVRG